MPATTRTDTHTLAVQVAVRLAKGTSWQNAFEQVATLNRCPEWHVVEATRYVADATCDPYLERLGAQYAV